MRIAVVGAGAAGCICAIELRRRLPDAEVNLYESGSKALAKVAVTGGGRCNLTNNFHKVRNLKDVYPRGFRVMERLLDSFGPEDTMEWFRKEGVRLKVEDEGRIFPVSDDAMQIVRTLENLLRRTGVNLYTHRRIGNISELDEEIRVITTGGNTLSILDNAGIPVVKCVPSLFTFNLEGDSLCRIPGIRVDNVSMHLPGSPFKSEGSIITTHWGISGPAVLKLSSYGARYLAEKEYSSALCINWLGDINVIEAQGILTRLSTSNPDKMVRTTAPGGIPSSVWKDILDKCRIREDIRWSEIGSKGFNRLKETLVADVRNIKGQSRFKEEFVSCGGIDWSGVNPNTLESKTVPGLYFAGEILDIDAVTGGFNLQAAWTTGYSVAKSIQSIKLKNEI